MKRITIDIREMPSRAQGYNLRVRSTSVGGVTGYEERMAGEVIADLAEFVRAKVADEDKRRREAEAQAAANRAKAIASETKLFGAGALSQLRADLAERLGRIDPTGGYRLPAAIGGAR